MPAPAAGTFVYSVGVIHVDRVNLTTTVEFRFGGVQTTTSNLIESSRLSFTDLSAAFVTALGADGTAFVAAIDTVIDDFAIDVAASIPQLSGVPWYGVGGTLLPAGTYCWDIAILHFDRVNSVVCTELRFGVVQITTLAFIETHRFQYPMTYAAFIAAFGAAGTTFDSALTTILADVPTDIVPLVPQLAGITYYGS